MCVSDGIYGGTFLYEFSTNPAPTPYCISSHITHNKYTARDPTMLVTFCIVIRTHPSRNQRFFRYVMYMGKTYIHVVGGWSVSVHYTRKITKINIRSHDAPTPCNYMVYCAREIWVIVRILLCVCQRRNRLCRY